MNPASGHRPKFTVRTHSLKMKNFEEHEKRDWKDYVTDMISIRKSIFCDQESMIIRIIYIS